MAGKKATQSVYYAARLLALHRNGVFLRNAKPGEVVDIEEIGIAGNPSLLQFHLDNGLLREEVIEISAPAPVAPKEEDKE